MGHNDFWRLFRFNGEERLVFQVMNDNAAIVDISIDTDYIIVARADDGNREVSLYNMKGELIVKSSVENTPNHISIGTNKICAGISEQKGLGVFEGYMRQLAIYDKYLNDDVISAILDAFVFQGGKLATQTKKMLGSKLDVDLCRRKCLVDPDCEAFAFK